MSGLDVCYACAGLSLIIVSVAVAKAISDILPAIERMRRDDRDGELMPTRDPWGSRD